MACSSVSRGRSSSRRQALTHDTVKRCQKPDQKEFIKVISRDILRICPLTYI